MQIAIRTDASLAIGTGHVMRCLTLADGLRAAGAQVTFICREHAGHQCGLIAARGHALRHLPAAQAQPDKGPGHAAWLGASWQDDARQTIAALPGRPDWLVVDHYALDAGWEQALRAEVGNIMVIDDLADRRHDCDLLLDQNLAADTATRYDALVPAACARLLGPSYALLRPEFAAARAAVGARSGAVQRLFVFLGGADAGNETGKVLAALGALARPGLQADVVIGGANPHAAAVAAQCAALPGVRLHRQVGNIAELMAAADLAVGAGGGAMWERCCLGLPSIVIGVADNQRGASEAMARQGRVLYLGQADGVDAELLRGALALACASPQLMLHLAQVGMETVDGGGAARVVRQLLRHGQQRQFVLRPAGAADCDPIWTWRNADIVRRFSGSTEAIGLEEHRRWFAAALANPERRIVLAELQGQVAGILRYDRVGSVATISVYLTPGFMGRGLGAGLIAQGSGWVAANWPGVATIEAHVRPENGASRAAFVAAGFTETMNIYSQRISEPC